MKITLKLRNRPLKNSILSKYQVRRTFGSVKNQFFASPEKWHFWLNTKSLDRGEIQMIRPKFIGIRMFTPLFPPLFIYIFPPLFIYLSTPLFICLFINYSSDTMTRSSSHPTPPTSPATLTTVTSYLLLSLTLLLCTVCTVESFPRERRQFFTSCLGKTLTSCTSPSWVYAVDIQEYNGVMACH